ncbi:proteasome activator subunit 4, partial [Phenoliferia sp. Uapishka_3]
MKKPADKLGSFAALIVYSMSVDSPPSGATPFGSTAPSRTTSPGPGIGLGAVGRTKTYLAGSKALDSLAKLIQATESFFHPSNYGAWAPILGSFLQHLTWEYHKRQKEEERADCKTPLAWRLTPEIRREFVLTMRTVALLSMFSRDAITIATAQAAIKTMGYLEPELIFPAVLERAYPALETLLETHRTTAIITALSTISPPLISRSVYPAGAKHLVPLLELCLPGLDVNDPIKTMSTAMFVIQAVISVMIDDLTRPELQQGSDDEPTFDESDVPMIMVDDGGEVRLTKAEEDLAVRDSTSGFPDWVSNFFRQVLVVFEALPEPGKGNRNGGKMEEQMTHTLIASCDFVCSQLSPTLFDLALDIVFKQVTTSIRSNSARVVSQLTSCFARADSAKTLKKFFPICAMNIRLELEQGASSVRTTSTNSPIESDVTLSWWIGLLTGSITNAGAELLNYREDILSLVKFMVEHCKSERGYTTTGRILGLLLISLTNVSVMDYRSVNKEEWNSDAWKKGHHKQWGRVYEAKDVKVEWHVPSPAEIDFALELLREIISPALDTIEELLRQPTSPPTPTWANDFCRYCNIIRSALSGIPSLMWMPPPAVPGAVASDAGDEVPDFINQLPHCQAGMCLTDPADPRHAFVFGLRERCGRVLHDAVHSLKNNGAEDSIDCVKMLIASIKILQLDYSCDTSHYTAIKKSYEFALQISRTTRNQKAFPRFVWVRRASLYHASRMRLNSFYRKRSALDDLLIADMCELALSVYVQIRRAAQKGLDSMTHYFDGTRTLIYETLFDALKPAPDHDVRKGPTTDYVRSLRAEAALEVLHTKMVQNLAILDWRYGPRYLDALLLASHFERPSVQKLVTAITHDFVIRLAEPSTLKSTVHSDGLHLAADNLSNLTSVPEDAELVAAVAAKATQRIDQKNNAYAELPLRPDVAAYVAQQLICDLPNQRTHSMLALTKVLHFIKLRTACGGSGEKLLLQQTSNPLRRKVKLERPLPADFTEKFIESFSKPMTSETLLMDKQSTGWLVWGDTVEYYAVPPETSAAITWDVTSAEAIEEVRALIVQPSWWETFIKHLSQEKTIDYLAADSMVRGSKHWPLQQQKKVWDWLTPLLPSIFDGMTPETQVAWEMCAEYILSSRDPRRNQPLVDYLTSLVIDPDSSEAFNTAKRQDLVGTAMKALGWHFSPWAAKYIEMYSAQLDHPFGEVRAAVADNLRHLSELRLHPSYDSVESFLRECRVGSTSVTKRGLMNVDAEYEASIDEFGKKLAAWRAVRVSSAHGTQNYDKAALTRTAKFGRSSSDRYRLPTIPDRDGATSHVAIHRALERLSELACSIGRPPSPSKFVPSGSPEVLIADFYHTVFYFHNLFLLDDEIVAELMEQLCDLLQDPKIEVREAAATALSGIVRCSQRSAIVSLSNRFMAVVRSTKIPKRRNAAGEEVAGYQETLVRAHSGVLGIASLINAFPYEVPPFIPSIMIETMSLHATSPVPISTTVKACLAGFKRSHTDSWAEDQKAFSEDQLVSLHDLLMGSSYSSFPPASCEELDSSARFTAMEVFVRRVPPQTSELDLKEAVSIYIRPSPLDPNFEVRCWTTKRNGRSTRLGTITVAESSIGASFLRAHGSQTGSPTIRLHGTAPIFSESTKSPSPELISKLKTTTFVDPGPERERIRQLEQLAGPIPLAGLSFGRITTDNAYSPEIEHSLVEGRVIFDGDHRRLEIGFELAGRRISVFVPFYSIARMQAVGGTQHSIILSLAQAPAIFDVGRGSSGGAVSTGNFQDMIAIMAEMFGTTEEQNRRLSAISPQDLSKAPFVLTTLALIFSSGREVELFRRRRVAVHLPRVQSSTITITRRDLYSSTTMNTVRALLARLNVRVAFQVDLLLYNGILSGEQVSQLGHELLALERRHGVLKAEHALALFGAHQLSSRQEKSEDWDMDLEAVDTDDVAYIRPFDPLRKGGPQQSSATTNFEELRRQLSKAFGLVGPRYTRRFTTDQSAVCRHVVITPTSLRFEGPFPDQSNSILRRYDSPENFIRVSLRDEDFDRLHFDREWDLSLFLRQRFLHIFTEGLDVAGRRFEFLGYSSSALKDHTAWFVARFTQKNGEVVTAETIRRRLGDFSKVNQIPARWMARVAQAFTATQRTITLQESEVLHIPDIEHRTTKSLFTDGVGTISHILSLEVDKALAGSLSSFQRAQRVQSTCYQVRLGGSKGMLAVDERLSGRKICIRPSMEKFDALDSLTLDVAGAFTKPLPAFLNRPLIKILEDLGVNPEIFLDLQLRAISTVQAAKTSPLDAAFLLERNGFSSSHLPKILRQLNSLGLNALEEPFVKDCIDLAISHALRDLKYRARIPVPDAWTLVGIADEDGYLQENEIYACIKRRGQTTIYLEGDICISRSPTIHPGDVRLNSIPADVAAGSRSLPSCLGGGDLDGDLYVLISTPDLLPLRVVPPASYEAPQMVRLGRPCTISDGAKFFLDYIVNDVMGVIATRHLQIADMNPRGTECEDCLDLASLHSDAVDYAKTGVSVPLKSLPKAPRERPDFLCPEWRASKSLGNYYESHRVLGRLFRSIPLEDVNPPKLSGITSIDPIYSTRRTLQDTLVDNMPGGSLGDPDEDEVSQLSQSIQPFSEDFLRLCRLHTLSKRQDVHLSEEEGFVGTMVAVSRDRRLRNDIITKLQEQTAALFEATRDEILGADDDDVIKTRRAWAAYNASTMENPKQFGVRSFAFIALGVLLDQIDIMNGEV